MTEGYDATAKKVNEEISKLGDTGTFADLAGIDKKLELSFPPKTGPLFWHGKGICDGSETTFGRGHTEAAA